MIRGMDPHRLAEARSLAYHRAIALAMVDDPGILGAARARLAEWQSEGGVHAHYVSAWANWLSLPVEDLVERLVDEGEQAIAMRQVSPFAGALSPQERWRIHRKVREAVEAG